MADGSRVEYVITIKGEGGQGSGNKSKTGASKKNGVAPSADGSSSGEFKKLGGLAVAGAVAIANKVVTTAINRVGITTGQTTFQERLNYTYNAAMRVTAIGGAILGGIATGNYLAAIAGAASAVSWGVEVAVADMNIQTERRVESISIRQANIRAGSSGDRNGKATY